MFFVWIFWWVGLLVWLLDDEMKMKMNHVDLWSKKKEQQLI